MAAHAGATAARAVVTPAVAVDRARLRYGSREVLRDVSFALPQGGFLAILGPNGAGKTTLLRVMVGVQRPDSGTVRLFGAPPGTASEDGVGYIPQVKTLDPSFPATALELVLTGLRHAWPWRAARAERGAARAALAQAGIEALAERQVSRLSGGELQRAYLARCLVRQPRLLVLDEPGAGLDIAGEAAMYHLLEDYRRASGATVAMITHDWEGARTHATHALLIANGAVAFGPPAEVASDGRLLDVFGYTGHKRRHGEE